MKIRVGGIDFEGYEAASAERHFLDLCGVFKFTTSPLSLQTQNYPIRVQQTCQIIVEETQFIEGFIEEIEVNSEGENHVSVTISGRDRTCDLVDSSIDNNFISQFDGNSTLADICTSALDALNIPNINVISTVTLPKLTSGNYVLPFIGELAYEFLQKYAKLSQVYLTTDGEGNILIQRSAATTNSSLLPINLINVFDGSENNVLSGTYKISTVNQYNLYKDYSQLSTTAIESGSTLFQGSMEQAGETTDANIRSGRQWVFIDDVPVDNRTAPQRAIWEMNYRRATGENYHCKVQGHTYDGVNIWQPNALIQVFDDFAGLNGRILLIDYVKFNESVDEGQTTELRCVNPLAYTLQTAQDYYQALGNTGQSKYFDFNQVGV